MMCGQLLQGLVPLILRTEVFPRLLHLLSGSDLLLPVPVQLGGKRFGPAGQLTQARLLLGVLAAGPFAGFRQTPAVPGRLFALVFQAIGLQGQLLFVLLQLGDGAAKGCRPAQQFQLFRPQPVSRDFQFAQGVLPEFLFQIPGVVLLLQALELPGHLLECPLFLMDFHLVLLLLLREQLEFERVFAGPDPQLVELVFLILNFLLIPLVFQLQLGQLFALTLQGGLGLEESVVFLAKMRLLFLDEALFLIDLGLELLEFFRNLAQLRLQVAGPGGEQAPGEIPGPLAEFPVATGLGSLALECIELAGNLLGDIVDAEQVLPGLFEFRGRQLALDLEFGDAGRFLDDGPSIRGFGAEDQAYPVLLDQRIGIRPQSGSQEHVLDIPQSDPPSVEEVLALSRTKKAPGYHQLSWPGRPFGSFSFLLGGCGCAVFQGNGPEGSFDPGLALLGGAGPSGCRVMAGWNRLGRRGGGGNRFLGHLRIDQGDADLGEPQGQPGPGAIEDDVLHSPAAQGPGALLPQYPGDGIGNVALAAPVGSHDGGDAGSLKGQFCFVGEGFEPLNLDLLQFQQLGRHPQRLTTDENRWC